MGSFQSSYIEFFNDTPWDNKYQFTFTKKKYYESLYIIYSDVKFYCEDIKYSNAVMPTEFTYKLMIVNKNTRDVWILNDKYEMIYKLTHNTNGYPILLKHYKNVDEIESENKTFSMKSFIDFWKYEESRKKTLCGKRKAISDDDDDDDDDIVVKRLKVNDK